MAFQHTKLAALAATLALSIGVAHAAPGAGDVPPPPPPGQGPAMHGPHGPHRGPAPIGFTFQRVHDQLKLDAQQEKLFQAARDTDRNTHEQMRALRHAGMEKMKAAGSQPILDLRAMRDAREQGFEQARQLHKQSEDAWLQFYDSLNDTQKTTVSQQLKANFQRMRDARPGPGGPGAAGRHGWHRHPGAHGPAAQAPADAAAPASNGASSRP